MKGRRQLMPRAGGPDLRAEIHDHVFRLNGALARMRADLRILENRASSHDVPDPEISRALGSIRREIDAVYRTMVRVRWAALGSPPGPDPGECPGPDPAGGPTGPTPRGRATIYVVDDDPSVRRALSRLFRSVDYRVETFPSARQFLKAEAGARPACLVLDVRMPRMGGMDLHRELADVGSGLPVVFITGHGDLDLAVKAIKDGAVDFLPKPFDDQDLLDAVERALLVQSSMGPKPYSEGTA